MSGLFLSKGLYPEDFFRATIEFLKREQQADHAKQAEERGLALRFVRPLSVSARGRDDPHPMVGLELRN